MKKKIIKYSNKIIRLAIVVFVAVLITGKPQKLETKVTNENLNRTLDLTSMALRVQEDIENNLFASLDTYTGHLTGYAADCPLCGGRLSCLPSYAVLQNGVTTYPDELYGEVNIVASSKNLPCGSIVKFEVPRISEEPVVAIVLDRGVGGTALDILMSTGDEARAKVGRMSVTYEVLRNGWER